MTSTERVRSLLAKANDAAASPPEAAAARRMADKIMRKAGITEANLNDPEIVTKDWSEDFDDFFSQF